MNPKPATFGPCVVCAEGIDPAKGYVRGARDYHHDCYWSYIEEVERHAVW